MSQDTQDAPNISAEIIGEELYRLGEKLRELSIREEQLMLQCQLLLLNLQTCQRNLVRIATDNNIVCAPKDRPKFPELNREG